MNASLSSALDSRSFDLSARVSGDRARQLQVEHWRRVHGAESVPPLLRMVGEHPLVASPRLQMELDRHVAELASFITTHVQMNPMRDRNLGAGRSPDVICADLAIVKDPTAPEGWTLRWVEFQAFTSILATLYTFHLAAGEIWPETGDYEFWRLPAEEQDWLRAVRAWAAPSGGVLLERTPMKQVTRYDLHAASRLFGLDMVEPHQLRRDGLSLSYQDKSERKNIHHIFNRLVMHELGDRAGFEEMIANASVSWHSHPSWYYGISKALLPYIPQGADNQCAVASAWRTLGLPAEALVAKEVNSYGGSAVLLHVDEQTLDALPQPQNWIVQPRFTPQPLFAASDGHPISGEVRCIVSLPADREPWLAGQFIRLSRGPKATTTTLEELPGGGMVLLYRPPAR